LPLIDTVILFSRRFQSGGRKFFLDLEFTGYQPNLAVQSSEAVRGIKMVIGPILAVLLCVGIFIANKYPLDRDDFLAIVDKIKERRASVK